MEAPNCHLTPSAVFSPSAHCRESLFEGVEERAAEGYLQSLAQEGWSTYAEQIMDGNRFSTLTRENELLTVMWLSSLGELRVVAEPLAEAALPPRCGEDVHDGVGCDVYFAQVGLNYRQGMLEGILDIARLSDGSFLILDGGHGLEENADRIYALLRHDAPDPNSIRVAAWVLTHAHEDHVGFFRYFAEKYANRVTVERFVYNFPSRESCTEAVYREGERFIEEVEQSIWRYFPTSARVCAHPGQVFYLRNAKLTVLYTHELFLPRAVDWFNTTSLVLTLELDGKKAFLPGDAGEAVAGLLLHLYSRARFASEILQVGHHGIVNTPYVLYPLVDPTYVLWPMGVGPRSVRYLPNGKYTPDCSVYLKCPFNEFLWASRKCANHIYPANDDIYLLTVKDGNISVSFYDNDKDYLNNNELKGFMS